MKRTDSGFHESFRSTASHNDASPNQKNNAAPTCPRHSTSTPAGSISSKRPRAMESQRPGSEDQSRPSHQRSTTSSSRNSADQSRGRRQHSSKPGSCGTSRTVVDPARPPRHYRIQSSHTAPTATSRDIDDPVALHFRSCSLFQNPSNHISSGLPSSSLSQNEHIGRPSIASRFSNDDVEIMEEQHMFRRSEEMMIKSDQLNKTMHWTSPSTRRKDYERIDRANTGIRGLFNRVMPRCISGPQEKFYEKDQSDAGSVRRYRLDDVENEKHRAQKHSVDVMHAPKKKRWNCF